MDTHPELDSKSNVPVRSKMMSGKHFDLMFAGVKGLCFSHVLARARSLKTLIWRPGERKEVFKKVIYPVHTHNITISGSTERRRERICSSFPCSSLGCF